MIADVAAVLSAYRNSGQYLTDTVRIGAKDYAALEPKDPNDFAIFVAELQVVVQQQRNELVADIIARNSPRLWDTVRMVNVVTKNGFKGMGARGDALLFNPLRLRDLGRAGGYPGTSPPDNWLQSYTSIGGTRLWPPTSGTVTLTVSSLQQLGHVFFGFVDPVPTPKVDAVQLVLDSDPWSEEAVPWEWRRSYSDIEVPTYELRQPWVIRPGAAYRVSVRVYATGDDRLQPIGFVVQRATDIIGSLAT